MIFGDLFAGVSSKGLQPLMAARLIKGKEQCAAQASDELADSTLNRKRENAQSSQLFAHPPGFVEEIQSWDFQFIVSMHTSE
ncbi:hypothetical protein MtrunA17_Chr4g0051161 [Medicago truncatula]|uniref:Uncharacterized protein n=1 Tax=Medicago truncatula TaxID=3880 RepID=A0A396IG93_MEDTR|nr:hypothetical protein MtrunA17_Chr4g0051161 [Medicago truncatula]